MAKDFFSALMKLEGSVNVDTSIDPFMNVIRTPSPSVNWSFGVSGHGLPSGMSMILWGPPKGGKSIILNSMIGQIHRDDPEAFTVSFNTELRAKYQTNKRNMEVWGIDPNRHISYDVNQPELIFDRIATDLAALCEQGMKLRLIGIDSLTNIIGRRTQNSDTILKQQIGDEALTIKDGLKMILPVIRKYNIATVMTAHIRAELDQREQMRGKTVKMAAAWATKHMAEFFVYVEPNQSKTGKVALDGTEFVDTATVDFMDKNERTGHKIRVQVTDSSVGPQGRTAEFTLDYDRGIINQFEEIFVLGTNLGIIERPNNVTYIYGDKKWSGKANMLYAIRDDSELQKSILDKVMALDAK